MTSRAVILDRDGVINHDSDAYIKSVQEWRPIDGSIEAIARLSHAGLHPVVITNQSGLARGLFDLASLEAIHGHLRNLLQARGVQDLSIYYCPHGPNDGCACRKPEPALYLRAARDLGFELNDTFAIGDSLRDLQAARAAGALPVLVRTGNGRDTEASLSTTWQVGVYDNLSDAADALLNSGAVDE